MNSTRTASPLAKAARLLSSRLGLAALLLANLTVQLGCAVVDPLDDDRGSIDDDDGSPADDDDSAHSFSQSWDASFSTDALLRLTATNTFGHLSLAGAPGATEVQIVVVVFADQPVNLGPFAPLSILEQPAALSITVAPPEQAEFSRIDLSLHGPSSLIAELSAGNFPLAVTDMQAGGTLTAQGGAVTGMGLAGNFEVLAGVSEILLEVDLPAAGSLSATLTSGTIETLLPATTSASLAASTGSGTIEISGMDFMGVVVGGEASGQFGAGAGSITLATGEGDITVRGQNPPDAPAN